MIYLVEQECCSYEYILYQKLDTVPGPVLDLLAKRCLSRIVIRRGVHHVSVCTESVLVEHGCHDELLQ